MGFWCNCGKWAHREKPERTVYQIIIVTYAAYARVWMKARNNRVVKPPVAAGVCASANFTLTKRKNIKTFHAYFSSVDMMVCAAVNPSAVAFKIMLPAFLVDLITTRHLPCQALRWGNW